MGRKKKIAIALACVAVVVGAIVGFGVKPAGAHNFDNTALWSCAYAARPDGSWLNDHSWPHAVYNGLVEYDCWVHDGDTGLQGCKRVKYDTNTGAIYSDDIYHFGAGNCPYPLHT
jgi:hypothetical protein